MEPKGYRPTYSDEFRRAAVRLARTSGQPHREIAEELGVSDRQLRRWVNAPPARDSAALALTAIERADLARLRRQVARLEEEQEILRKAASFFARETR